MRYDPDSFTVGAELEYADVDRHARLPSGCRWNRDDYTIVNTSGVANDPLGKLWAWGGEVNTKPSATVDEQVCVIEDCIATLRPVINYRCNLHVHVRVPGLSEDLAGLKTLFAYVWTWDRWVFEHVEPMPKPEVDGFTPDEYRGAVRRWRHSMRSHQYRVSPARAGELMAATTPQAFYEAHAPIAKGGKRAWSITPRAGINLRAMWQETNTIEFRHFPGTLDLDEYGSALAWCVGFLDLALNKSSWRRPEDLFRSRRWCFPRFRRYNHHQETLWRRTSVGVVGRAKARQAIHALVQEGLTPP